MDADEETPPRPLPRLPLLHVLGLDGPPTFLPVLSRPPVRVPVSPSDVEPVPTSSPERGTARGGPAPAVPGTGAKKRKRSKRSHQRSPSRSPPRTPAAIPRPQSRRSPLPPPPPPATAPIVSTSTARPAVGQGVDDSRRSLNATATDVFALPGLDADATDVFALPGTAVSIPPESEEEDAPPPPPPKRARKGAAPALAFVVSSDTDDGYADMRAFRPDPLVGVQSEHLRGVPDVPSILDSPGSSPLRQSVFSQDVLLELPPLRPPVFSIRDATRRPRTPDDDDVLPPSPVVQRDASSSPAADTVMDFLRLLGSPEAEPGMSTAASPAGRREPPSPVPRLFDDELDVEPADDGSGRASRRTKQLAKRKIDNIYDRYGPIVRLTRSERGVPVPEDDEPSQSQAAAFDWDQSSSEDDEDEDPTIRGPLSPQDLALSPPSPRRRQRPGARDSPLRDRGRSPPPPLSPPRPAWDLSPRLPPPSPPRREIALIPLRRPAKRRRTNAEPAVRDRPSDLFDRMVVRDPAAKSGSSGSGVSRRSATGTSSGTRTRPLLHSLVDPELRQSQPQFVRVATRSIRHSVARTSSRSSAPVSPTTLARRVYGNPARKVIRIDGESDQVLRPWREEQARRDPLELPWDGVARGAASTPAKPPRKRAAPAAAAGRSRGSRASVVSPPRRPRPPRKLKATRRGEPEPERRSSRSRSRSPLARGGVREPRSFPAAFIDDGPMSQDTADLLADWFPAHEALPLPPSPPATRPTDLDTFTGSVPHSGGALAIRRRREPTSATGASAARPLNADPVPLRQVQVNALAPADSCLFCIVAHLSGDVLELSRPLPPDLAAPPSIASVVTLIEDSTIDSLDLERALAVTHAIGAQSASVAPENRAAAATRLTRLFASIREQLQQPVDAGPPVQLFQRASWLALWLTMLHGFTAAVAPATSILRTLLSREANPLRSGLSDAFQSLLLCTLVAVPDPTSVFNEVLSIASLGESDKWRILVLAQALGQLLTPAKVFIAWDTVRQHMLPSAAPAAATADQVHALRLSFGHVYFLVVHYVWPVIADVLLAHHKLFLALAAADVASPPRLGELYPAVTRSADRMSIHEQFFSLIDKLDDLRERQQLAVRLLPTKLGDLSTHGQRLVLALVLRSQLNPTQFLAQLTASDELLDVLLPELFDVFSQSGRLDAVADLVAYLGNQLRTRLGSPNPAPSALLSIIALLQRFCAVQHQPVENCLLRQHADLLDALLAPATALRVRFAAVDLITTLVGRYAVFPQPRLPGAPWDVTMAEAEPSASQQQQFSMGSDDFGLDEDLFFAAIEGETSYMKEVAATYQPAMRAIETNVLAPYPHANLAELNGATSDPDPVASTQGLFVNAIRTSALLLKLASTGNPDAFAAAVNQRIGHIRWPAATVPLPVRSARAMLLALHLLRLGCRLPEQKLTELLGLALFQSNAVDAVAVPLVHAILGVCGESEMLAPCVAMLARPLPLTRALLAHDIIDAIVKDLRNRRADFRGRAFRLLPHLKVLHAVIEQVAAVGSPAVQPMHDLLSALEFESSITGQQLPPDLASLASLYRTAQTPAQSIGGVVRGLTKVLAEIGGHPAGGDQHRRREVQYLLGQFDGFFDTADARDLATVMAQRRPPATVATDAHAQCERARCPQADATRAALIAHLAGQWIGAAADWQVVAKALRVLSLCYETLVFDSWCFSELAPVLAAGSARLGFLAAMTRGNSYACRMVSSEFWRLVTVACGPPRSSFLSPNPPLLLRKLFPASVAQMERITGYAWRDRGAFAELARDSSRPASLGWEQALVPPQQQQHQQVAYHGGLDPTAADFSSEQARREANHATLSQIFRNWAACVHGDAEIRDLLAREARSIDLYLGAGRGGAVHELWTTTFVRETAGALGSGWSTDEETWL
ncbi:hypothetical protein H9P43_002272 [Blastocladiella emersonii ATCC 22665]|nr:hypothetical protein H9P43_002272 [Blastocladiella emersonii ATCC 22665]